MMFKIDGNPTHKIRGWCMHIKVDGSVQTYRSLHNGVVPEWYEKGAAQVICPTMMEGWSKRLLTARQV